MSANLGSAFPDTELQQILTEESTKKYYIEYGGFLANHLSHGIIALQRLGAPRKRIDDFIKWYVPRLEEPGQHQPEKEHLTIDKPEIPLGQRNQFYPILQNITQRVDRENIALDELIAEEFPKLQLGMPGSALHGLIHLGYGFAAMSKQITLEGIAYLYHSYSPLIFSADKFDLAYLGKGKSDILEVIEKAREDETLRATMLEVENSQKWQAKNTSPFQRRSQGLFEVAGDRLLDLVYEIKFPKWFDGNCSDMAQVVKLSGWVLDCAITAYAKSSQRNDFFLIHGVTAAWSLKQVIPVLKSYNSALESIRTFLALLIATYLARSSPALSVSIDPTIPCSEDCWKDIIKEALAMETDEHVYKLVQVCNERCKEVPENGALYMSAAKSAISEPLHLYLKEN